MAARLPKRFLWGVLLILAGLVGLIADQQTPLSTTVIGALFASAIGGALIVSAVRAADRRDKRREEGPRFFS